MDGAERLAPVCRNARLEWDVHAPQVHSELPIARQDTARGDASPSMQYTAAARSRIKQLLHMREGAGPTSSDAGVLRVSRRRNSK